MTIDFLVNELKQRGFHLGGSRRMAEKYPDRVVVGDSTDWDFYCADKAGYGFLLKEYGFTKIQAENRQYWDNLLLDMYKHDSYPIEVLIRSDVALYQRSFDSIPADDFVNKLWKSSPHIQVEDKAKFRGQVCDYFNRLFRENSQIPIDDEVPF